MPEGTVADSLLGPVLVLLRLRQRLASLLVREHIDFLMGGLPDPDQSQLCSAIPVGSFQACAE